MTLLSVKNLNDLIKAKSNTHYLSIWHPNFLLFLKYIIKTKVKANLSQLYLK